MDNNLNETKNEANVENVETTTASKANVVVPIVGAILLGLFILGIALYFLLGSSKKMECKSSEGNIMIMYNDKTLTGYKVYNMTYEFEEQREYAEKIGVDSYLKEFNEWFLNNTSGKCYINGKEVKRDEKKADEKLKDFYADGYNLKYGSKWNESTITSSEGTEKAIVYNDNKAYIVPLGISSLSEYEDELEIDFSNESGKNKLYNEFYENWLDEGINLTGGSNGFKLLKDDVYYANVDFKLSESASGKIYLLVKPDNNVIISIISRDNGSSSINSDAFEVIKNIEIQKKYDNELSNMLDSMSNWNRYSDLRKGDLGKNKDINGGWLTLSDAASYWEFKNGEFWWYKSKDVKNDNYWYGTTKILTGKEGLKEVGLDESKVDYITANAGEKVTSDNIYTIIMTPTKIISGGVDKSSTNIDGNDWHMVWIIVDHGNEGLEAQTINVKTAETTYLVKVSD